MRKDSGADRPFRRVLIANRGEIALRIIRACRELGIETVAVYSDADVDAAHVRAADVAVRLGPAPAAESYLRADAIIDAALRDRRARPSTRATGSCRARLVRRGAVEEAGLVFVGPSSATRSTRSATSWPRGGRRATAGVPVVPGTFEPRAVDRPDAVDGDLADARARSASRCSSRRRPAAAAAGMRRVDAAGRAAGGAGRRIAPRRAAAFGDGAVYLEREIRPARHIEVQLLGDAERRRSSRSASATARSSAATRSSSRNRRRPG